MRKALAILFILSALLLLFACGKDTGGASTTAGTTSSATTQPTSTSSKPATETTTVPTVPVTTIPSSTTTAPTTTLTTATTSSTTKQPTSTTQPTTGATAPTTTDLKKIFQDYPGAIYDLARFYSLDELPAYQVFIWCKKDIEPCATENYWDSEYSVDVFKFYYSVAELDEITLKYLGRTWDYSTIVNTDYRDNAQYSCDADTNTVVLTYLIEVHELPPEDARLRIEYRKYTVIDSTHFEIEYFYRMVYGPEYIVSEIWGIQVELTNGNYIVTSHYLIKKV